MLFYDLDQSAWVRQPGSNSPPWSTPVLPISGKSNVAIQFLEGGEVITPAASDWMAVVNLDGDFSANHLAESITPFDDGTGAVVFTLDLTTPEALAYFTANPDEPTVKCQLQIGFTYQGDSKRTVALAVILQNDYIQA